MSDGTSEGDHRASAAAQWARLGRKDLAVRAAAVGPELPFDVMYLWEFYNRHSMGLAVNGMATPVITWEGLRAWCELMQVELEPWEANALVELGRLRANIESERKDDGTRNPVRSGRAPDIGGAES